MRKIEVINYDSNWGNQFEAEKKLLNSTLGLMIKLTKLDSSRRDSPF